MKDIPPLKLWRTLPADQMTGDPELMQELVAHLAARLVPRSDRERRLLDGLVRCETAENSLRLAALHHGRWYGDDLAMTSALTAALGGSNAAALVLAQALLGRAQTMRQKAARRLRRGSASSSTLRREARRAFRLALTWLEPMLPILENAHHWARDFAALSAPVEAVQQQTAAVADAVEEPNEAPAGPSLTLVAEIGDDKSEAGTELAQVYDPLCKPLPLKGADPDLDTLEEALRQEFPHFVDAIAAAMRDLRLQRYVGRPWLRLRPLLLAGPPGVGKTRFVKRLAELLGLGYGEFGAAGSSDDRALRGTARGWRGAQPALPLLVALRTGCANPLILIDELDKAGGNERHGDVRQSLLSLLEPETARTWFDEALLAPCDLSQVSWLFTANETTPLSAPMLSRLSIVRCPAPRPEDFAAITLSILDDIARTLGVERMALPEVHGGTLEALRAAFARTGDIRQLRRALEAALGAAAAAPRTQH